jgi:tRNA G18 (ribose-2'-O)-methylase SpoU
MRRLFQFSEKTFRAMAREQQHKKCAELLKELYCNRSQKELIEEYQKFCTWMELFPISLETEELEQRFHRHIRLSGRPVSEHDFLKNLSCGDNNEASPWLEMHIYLDGLRSCHNVGSILRTVEAFRLGDVHLSADMMEPTHPQIQKTSMGAWSFVRTTHGIEMALLPRPWIALETIKGAASFDQWIYPKTGTLFVGNEERGIRAAVLQQCNDAVTIPLFGHKNSLNVANAFAIVASEIASQHRR